MAVTIRLFVGLWFTPTTNLEDSYYSAIALDILNHKNLGTLAMTGMTVERTPLYTMLLVTVFYLGGISSATALVAHAFLGGLITLFAYLLARQSYDSRTGLLAAFIVALYPYYVGNNIGLTDEPLLTLDLAVDFQDL